MGEYGTIFHTADGGTTWVTQNSGVQNSFFACQAVDANNAWAVGIDSIVLRTQDGGTTWEKMDTGITRVLPFYNVYFQDHDYGVVCGQGVVLCTDNGGATWQASGFKSAHIDYVWLYGLSKTINSNSTRIWMAGEGGRIFWSADYGKMWEEITY